MGPILICDKSTLQGLSRAELNLLRRNYSLNIPPVLLMEILADLKKATDVTLSRIQVQKLADKLLPACCAVNVGYRDLVIAEIEGHEVRADGRPILRGGKAVASGGKTGVVFDQGPEEEALLRWQVGNFLEAEEFLADAWRCTSQGIDLEAMQRMLRSNYATRMIISSLDEAAAVADNVLQSATPSHVLRWFLTDCEILPDSFHDALTRFDAENAMHARLPFTVRCMRLALIFHFGLAFGLISTRATNRIDLEYLYYVPFCNVFSSGDTLHQALLPFVLRADQVSVTRDVFKADLNGLAIWWSGLTEEEKGKERQRSGPPKYDQSITYQIWRKFMKPGWRDNVPLKEKMSAEAEQKMMQHISELMKGAVPAESMAGSLDDCDFAVRKHSVRLDGPCICGSHMTFRECCGRGIVTNQ
jgi:hypothetical protein